MNMKKSEHPDSISAIESKLHSGPEAYERFKDFTRRIVAVPKAEIDKRIAEDKKTSVKRSQRRKAA